MTDGKTQPGALAGRFGCNERVEHLLLDLGRDPRPVVPNSDLHFIAEVLGRSQQHRLVITAICFRFPLGCRVKSIGDQVQQHPGDLLRIEIDLPGHRIEGAFDRDVEALLLGACAMISEIKALIDDCIDIDRPVLT